MDGLWLACVVAGDSPAKAWSKIGEWRDRPSQSRSKASEVKTKTRSKSKTKAKSKAAGESPATTQPAVNYPANAIFISFPASGDSTLSQPHGRGLWIGL